MPVQDEETITACGGAIKDVSRYPSALFRGRRVHFYNRACLHVFETDPERFIAGEIGHPRDEEE